MITLTTLGSLELQSGGTPVLTGRRKVLALLAFLARQREGPVERSELACLLWDQSDSARAKQSLRQALSELRSAMGPALEIESSTLTLHPDTVDSDVARFEAAIHDQRWEQAVAVWRGDFLPGLEDQGDEVWRSWLERERAGLRRQLAWALDRLVVEHESRADWSAAIRAAERWCAALPEDERGWVRLVQCLRSADRRAEAAARAAGFVARARSELGVEPSAELLRLAAELETTDSTRSPRGRGLLTPDLVGREEVFASLTDAWRQVIHGPGRVVVFDADAGLGQSRLVRELSRFIQTAPAAGFVLHAQAFASERERPWSTIRPLLARLASAPGLGAAPPSTLAGLARIAPEIRERFPTLPPPQAGETSEDLARALTEVAVERPVLLVVDDAPEADPESQEVVASLVRRPPDRVLIVLTGRRDAWTDSAMAADLDRAAAHVLRLSLAPLDPEQTRTVVATMVPLAPGVAWEVAERIHRETGGIPADIVRFVTQMADDGLIAPDAAGQWNLTSELQQAVLPIPSDVREATTRRVAQLGPEARTLLEAASVVGPAINPRLLEEMSGVGPAAFHEAIADLASRRFLRESTVHPGRLELTGEATRRAIYDLIEPPRRRELHRAAHRLLRSSTVDSPELRQELARHRHLGTAGRRALARRGLVAMIVVTTLVIAVAGFLLRASRTAFVQEGSAVLLADVQNLTGDSTFDRALAVAATVGLEQSRRVVVFPRARVPAVLARMARPVDTVLSEALAREVAERQNLAVVVVLAVARFDSTFLLTARVVEPRSGNALRTERVDAPSRAEILAALDDLLRRVRRDLGESRSSVRANSKPLPEVTTASLEALRAYADGGRSWRRRDYADARDHFLRATALDSGFALAHAALADYLFDLVNDRDAGERHLGRALSLASRLTEREQVTLQFRAARRRGPAAEAARLGRLLAERYPDRETWFNLGTTLMQDRQCREAIPALERALSYDTLYTNSYLNIATCHQFLGEPEKAIRAYEAAEKTDSTALVRGSINGEWGQALLRVGRAAAAESAFRRMMERSDPNDRGFGLRSLAYLATYRGRYGEAIGPLSEAAALYRNIGASLSLFRTYGILAMARLAGGDTAGALTELDRARVMLPGLSPSPAFLVHLGYTYIRAGRPDRGREVLTQISTRVVPTNEADRSAERVLQAKLLLHAGRSNEVLATITGDRHPALAPYRLALASDAQGLLGRPDSALVAARELTEGWHFGWEAQEEWVRGPLRVARIAELAGDSVTARAAYHQFLEHWKDGDLHLPELAAARRRLAALQAPRTQ